jgi:predicted TIM-barrel fold metal-dependent hydrolase
MINDVHCHFFSSRFLELLAPDAGGADQLSLKLQWEPPGTPTELGEKWIGELDRHGVARAALIASIPGDAISVAEAVAHHPERFVGFFMHNPMGIDADAALTRSLMDYQMHGICLFPAMHGYRLDDECVERVFRAAADRGAVVFVLCGVLTVGIRKKLGLPSRFDLRLGDPRAVARLALAFPQVPFIIPHFGAGTLREVLMAADVCPNLHVDTSSSNNWTRYTPGLTLQAVFGSALSVLGPRRILFGTDSSFFPRGWQQGVYEEQKRIVDALGTSAADTALIFGGNFDALFTVPARP